LGSAIYADGTDAEIAFYNNLLIGPSGQNAVYCDPQNQQTPTFANNNAFSPNGTGLGGACSSQNGQSGNIGADPLFIDAGSADFHLNLRSPPLMRARIPFPGCHRQTLEEALIFWMATTIASVPWTWVVSNCS
jgi:hypothetical protein